MIFQCISAKETPQGSIYPIVQHPGASKTVSWASGFGQNFLLNSVAPVLKKKKIL